MYQVKEIFLTLQGEGGNAGRVAVFCRFSGCNLWSGREQDRTEAICQFCDTDFVGTDGVNGGRFDTAADLAVAIANQWTSADAANRFVVLTGGEPMLQVDDPLIDALHKYGFQVAIETNGTLAVPPEIDWICVSPKAGADLVQQTGHELKLVYPQTNLAPDDFVDLDFTMRLLQPMDGPQLVENTRAAVAYCQNHPEWRLSVQTHKVVGIP